MRALLLTALWIHLASSVLLVGAFFMLLLAGPARASTARRITHEEIRGLLPARTTGFRAAAPTMHDAIRVGDPIRFSLRGTLADDAVLVAIERW